MIFSRPRVKFINNLHQSHFISGKISLLALLLAISFSASAGADKKFVWAKAKIEGGKIIVSSDKVPAPLFVRYARADSPPYPNLVNKEGLPASPFRTDNF